MHGDLQWEHNTPTSTVTHYLTDHVPVMLIRTLKSETATGLSSSLITELKEKHKLLDGDEMSWLSTGQYGVIQFCSASS